MSKFREYLEQVKENLWDKKPGDKFSTKIWNTENSKIKANVTENGNWFITNSLSNFNNILKQGNKKDRFKAQDFIDSFLSIEKNLLQMSSFQK